MPLVASALASALTALFDGPPATRALCADAWGDAVGAYAAGIVPSSATVAAAAAALGTALASAFAQASGAAAMEAAFSTFAAAVGAGMAGYTPTPPPSPVGFANLFQQPVPSTRTDAAEQFADLIHAWLTTGTSTLVAPPNTLVTWS